VNEKAREGRREMGEGWERDGRERGVRERKGVSN
jgi:hypothetical protein